MSILDPQYNVQPLGYELDTRYIHLILMHQRILEKLYKAEGLTDQQALIEAHRDMTEIREDALERARILNADS